MQNVSAPFRLPWKSLGRGALLGSRNATHSETKKVKFAPPSQTRELHKTESGEDVSYLFCFDFAMLQHLLFIFAHS